MVALGGLLNQSAAVRDRAMTFPFRLAWTFALGSLKEAEEDGDNTEEAGGTSDLDGGGGAGGVGFTAAGGATVALGGARGLVTRLGVRVLATASEGALDGAIVLLVLESGASVVEVLHGNEGEGTTDIVDLGKRGTVNLLVNLSERR
jgi:hypothetical protein